MSSPEEVALDALRELGIERVTIWHLRCVEEYLRAMERLGGHFREQTWSRLESDLCGEESCRWRAGLGQGASP